MAIKGARADEFQVTPHLMVRGGRKAVEFYVKAFGATLLYESPMPHGSGIHAHLRVGRTLILVTDEQPPSPEGMAIGVAAPESLGATTTILEYCVDDVDAAYQRAVDAGAKPMLPLCDAFYGDRMGWVMDPCGHIWALSMVREELTPEEVQERMAAAHRPS
jgi:PhnB protein